MKQPKIPESVGIIAPMNANRVKLPDFLTETRPKSLKTVGKWVLEEKYDGNRAQFYFHGGRVYVASRTQKDMSLHIPWVNKPLNENHTLALALEGTVVEGEILPPPGFGLPDLRSALGGYPASGIKWQEEHERVGIVLFDILRHPQAPERELNSGRPTYEWSAWQRRRALEDALNVGPLGRWFVSLDMPTALATQITHHQHFHKHYARITRAGGEGVMLKDQTAPYRPGKRGNAWLKVKREETWDYVVTGFTDAEELNDKGERTKFAGMIGAVKYGAYVKGTQFVHGIEPVTIGQCSGMDNATRMHMTKNPDHWIGRVIEIAGQQADPETHVIRHPNFVGVRDDKEAHECLIPNYPKD